MVDLWSPIEVLLVPRVPATAAPRSPRRGYGSPVCRLPSRSSYSGRRFASSDAPNAVRWPGGTQLSWFQQSISGRRLAGLPGFQVLEVNRTADEVGGNTATLAGAASHFVGVALRHER
jgi:hypothetical protein